jgi:hypothetical protein
VSPVKLSLTLYMDRRDVTPWVQSLTLRQAPRALYLQADVTFHGWWATDLSSRWDLYGTYDPTVPRSELLLRGGIIPPDQPAVVTLKRGEPVPSVTPILDWAYFAQRVTARRTIVVAPDRSSAQRAIAAYEGPIGAHAILTVDTMNEAVRQLASLTGFNVELRIPDYPIAATVLDPEQSLWDHIFNLVTPFKPEIYFRRDRCSVMIADTVGQQVGVGQTLNFSDDAVKSFEVSPTFRAHRRRVLIKVPPSPRTVTFHPRDGRLAA